MSEGPTAARQMRLGVEKPRKRAHTRADFIEAPSNATALALIEGWADWPNGQASISGPEGSGKTHLAHIWMDLSGAERMIAAHLTVEDVPDIVAVGAVVVEGADFLGDGAERALFHLLNLAKAEGAALLLTGRVPPARWKVGLPDLASRISAITHAPIDPPGSELFEKLLAKHFSDRHLRVSEDALRFLAPRLEQTTAIALSTANRLEAAVADEARGLTVPFIKETLDL